jgi:hypothetical protein
MASHSGRSPFPDITGDCEKCFSDVGYTALCTSKSPNLTAAEIFTLAMDDPFLTPNLICGTKTSNNIHSNFLLTPLMYLARLVYQLLLESSADCMSRCDIRNPGQLTF